MDATDKLGLTQNTYVDDTASSTDGLTQLEELRFTWEGGPAKIQTEIFTLFGEALVVLRNAYDDKYTLLRYFSVGGKWVVSNDSNNANTEAALDWLNNPRVL